MGNATVDIISQIHDNTIKSYYVDFNEGILKMETCLDNKESSTIEFMGLLAHKFENVISTNTIFGLYKTTIESFIMEEKENLSESLKYGFPSMKANSYEELGRELEKEQYKVFYIDSSLGLFGYVIAKDIRVISNKK